MKTQVKQKVCRRACVVFPVLMAFTSSAATYTGAGADPSVLSDVANWNPSSWASSETLTLGGSVNDADYKLTSTLPAALKLVLSGFASARIVDLGGFFTNIPELRLESNTQNKMITVKGGASNLSLLHIGYNTDVTLRDGTYQIADGGYFRLYNWNSNLTIGEGASLVLDKASSSSYSGMQDGNQSTLSNLKLDGGTLVVKNESDIDAYLHIGGTGSSFVMSNGAFFDNQAAAPGLLFNTGTYNNRPGRFSITDSTFCMTNGNNASRGLMLHPHASTVAVTNSTVKFPQMYCGYFSNARYGGGTYYAISTGYNANDSVFTFHNSTIVGAFMPGSAYDYSGIFFGHLTSRNGIIFDGPLSAYSSAIFALGGMNNMLTVADGTFYATKFFDFAPGCGCEAHFTGGNSTLNSVKNDNTNSLVKITGCARVAVNGDFNLSAPGAGARVSGGCLEVNAGRASAGLIKMTSTRNYLETTGSGVTTGRVQFASSGSVLTVADGAKHVAMRPLSQDTQLSGISFVLGNSGNVVIISNSVFESAMPFAYNCVFPTAEGPQRDAVPFTGCPGCRIELKGPDARFVISSTCRFGDNDWPWYSCALGEMIDRSEATPKWTTKAYALDNPVRVKFCIPKDGYSEAPFRVTAGTAVLGGNAEFEFDASDYEWPSRRTFVPLVYNANAYKGWSNRLYLNIDQLNVTNADRLPVNPNGRKAQLALSSDGKTLGLQMPGVGGSMILFR